MKRPVIFSALKSFPWLAAMAVLAALVLPACKSSNSNTITLRCSDWSGGGPEEIKILNVLARQFEKDHPGVKIVMEQTPWAQYIPKLLTEFAAHSAPDVILVEVSQVASFTSRGSLVDLKLYLEKDPSLHLKDFYPEALAQYTVDHGLYAIPRDISPTCVVYYNKKKFDEAGVPYPKSNWDYLQFLKTAQKLTKKDAQGRTVQYGFVDEWTNYEAWIYAFGGNLVDNEKKPTRCTMDSAQAVAGVQFRADLMYKYGVTPKPSNTTAMGGLGNSDFFMNGTDAMFLSGIWVAPQFRLIKDFDWDAAELPKGPHGHRGFGMGGAGYAIMKSSPHPDLAYELAKYFGGEVGQRYMAATGLTQPALRTLVKSKAFLDGQKPASKGFLVDAVKDGHCAPFDPNEAEWSGLLTSALDRVWNGTEQPAPVLKKVVAEVNEKFFNKK